MSGLLVITRPGASVGFRCAGIDSMEAPETGDISELLLSIQDEGKYGLVVVDEPLIEGVKEIVMKRMRKKGLPIIVDINIPDKWEEMEVGESPVVRLIRKAIGYQIKIKR
jgi:vacuolar-type H+-ATPase subunit F/Vma7